MFDELLTGVMSLTNAEIDERIRANELEQRRLQAEQAALISVAQHRHLHADHEHRSINGYLRQTLNCSSSEASRLRSVARAVDHINGLGDAWLVGRVGISQVGRFAKLYGNRRVRRELPAAVPLLLDDAERLSYVEFEICVQRFEHHADLDGAHDARDDAIEHRDAQVVDVGGSVHASVHGGDPITSAELVGIFGEFCDREYRADLAERRRRHGDEAEQHPLPRTNQQRRFDAVVSLFRAARTASEAGSPIEPTVNILIDARTWVDLLNERGLTPKGEFGGDLLAELTDSAVAPSDRRCETSTGVPVHPHDVLRAALAGHVRRVVVDSASRVIDLGRKQRLFTGAAREAAMLLVTHCEHPGCDLPADWCDVDHSIEWAAGGPTDQQNSGVECGLHNVAKTTRRWRTKRATNGRNCTIRDDGTIVLPVGARPPTFPDESDDDPANDPAEITRMTNLARARAAALRSA